MDFRHRLAHHGSLTHMITHDIPSLTDMGYTPLGLMGDMETLGFGSTNAYDMITWTHCPAR